MGAMSNWQQEQFDAKLRKLVVAGSEAGVPWMADALQEMLDAIESRPAGRTLVQHLEYLDAVAIR
jgi:hypothetical protein